MKFDTETKYKLGMLLSCAGGLLLAIGFLQPDDGDTKSIMLTFAMIMAISGLFLAIKSKGGENS